MGLRERQILHRRRDPARHRRSSSAGSGRRRSRSSRPRRSGRSWPAAGWADSSSTASTGLAGTGIAGGRDPRGRCSRSAWTSCSPSSSGGSRRAALRDARRAATPGPSWRPSGRRPRLSRLRDRRRCRDLERDPSTAATAPELLVRYAGDAARPGGTDRRRRPHADVPRVALACTCWCLSAPARRVGADSAVSVPPARPSARRRGAPPPANAAQGADIKIGSDDFYESEARRGDVRPGPRGGRVQRRPQPRHRRPPGAPAGARAARSTSSPEYVGSGLGYYDKDEDTGDGPGQRDGLQTVLDDKGIDRLQHHPGRGHERLRRPPGHRRPA